MKEIITADWHIGQTSDSFIEENGQERSINETEKQMYCILDYAIKNKIKKINILGDIFETQNPISKYNEIFNKFLKKCNSLGIEIILVAGNHCQNNSGGVSSISPVKKMNFENISVFDEKIESYTFGDINYITIPHLTKKQMGIENIKNYESGQKKYIKDEVLKNIKKDKKNIIFTHIHIKDGVIGSEQKRLRGGINIFPKISSGKIDFIFSGHLHSYQTIKMENINCFYPGSITRNDFSECKEDKGFIVFDNEKLSVDFVKLKTTDYKVVKINLIEKGNINLNEEKVKKSVNKKIVKIIIDISEDNKKRINLEDILNIFSKYCFVAKTEVNVIKKEIKISEIKSYNPIDVFKSHIKNNVENKEQRIFVLNKGVEILTELYK